MNRSSVGNEGARYGSFSNLTSSEVRDRAERFLREIRAQANSHAIHPCEDAESVALGFAAAKISGLPLLLGQPGLAADLPDRIRVRAVGSGAEWAAQRGQGSLAHAAVSVGMFTSGSTGGPKLVLHDTKSTDHQARVTAQAMSVNTGEVAVVALPMDHAYGFSVLNAAWMSSFTTLHISPLARSTLVSLLRSGRVASLDSIAPVWDYLLRASQSDDLLRTRLADLQLRGVGGQMLSTRLETAWAEIGAPLNNGYGLTEAGPNVAVNVTSGYRPGSVGRPLPEVDVRVASDGELLVRSPSVARHLWRGGIQRNPHVDESGWLSTGDAASVSSDGYVSIMGRKDSIVIQRSKKLAIEAIEDAINLNTVSDAYTFIVKSGRRSDGSDRLLWLFAHVLDADAAQALLKSSLRLVPPPFALSDGKVISRDPRSLRTPAGKPRRDLILELLLSDSDR